MFTRFGYRSCSAITKNFPLLIAEHGIASTSVNVLYHLTRSTEHRDRPTTALLVRGLQSQLFSLAKNIGDFQASSFFELTVLSANSLEFGLDRVTPGNLDWKDSLFVERLHQLRINLSRTSKSLATMRTRFLAQPPCRRQPIEILV